MPVSRDIFGTDDTDTRMRFPIIKNIIGTISMLVDNFSVKVTFVYKESRLITF